MGYKISQLTHDTTPVITHKIEGEKADGTSVYSTIQEIMRCAPNPGFRLKYNTATSGDPGVGKFLFDNANITIAGSISINEEHLDGGSTVGMLDEFNVCERAFFTAIREDNQCFIFGYLLERITDNGSFRDMTFAYISTTTNPGAAALANNDIFRVCIIPQPGMAGCAGNGTCSGVPGFSTPQAVTSITVTGQRRFFTPFVIHRRTRLAQVDFRVGATAANTPTYFFGIYKWDFQGRPTTLLGSVSQAVAVNTTYNKALSLLLEPSLYAIGFLADKVGTQTLSMPGYNAFPFWQDMFLNASNIIVNPMVYGDPAGSATALANPNAATMTKYFDWASSTTEALVATIRAPCYLQFSER